MSKSLFKDYQLAEERGHIPRGTAGAMTMANILEAGVRGVAEGYYGTEAVNEAFSKARDEQFALDLQAQTMDDIRVIRKVYGDYDAWLNSREGKQLVAEGRARFGAAGGGGLTSSDFPKALAALRQRIIRQATPVGGSDWRSWVPQRNIRTVPDFKQIRGIKAGEMGELKLRPEAKDAEYTAISWTDDGYFMANYERATSYTWEMWVNDEIGAFMTVMRKLGQAGGRTEAIVIFNAIYSGLSRSSETGITTGSPTAARIQAARKAMAARTITDEDGTDSTGQILATDIIFPTEWEDDVEIALGTRYTDINQGKPNVVYRKLAPHLERLWARVFTSDWVLFDREIDWLEVAFLQGFQGGPLTYTKMPDETEHPEQGSFDNHSLAIKVGHTLGAKVTNTDGALRNQGA